MLPFVLLLHHLLLLPFASSFPIDTITTPLRFLTDPNVPALEDDYLANLLNLSTPSATLAKRAVTLSYSSYDITIDGQTTANWEPFLVSGTLVVMEGISSPGTTNGVNPYEVLISIGSPLVNPIAGSLRYTTQRALYQLFGGAYSPALLDFAFVSVASNGATVVTVDPALAASNQASVFNARSGLTANAWLVASGELQFAVLTTGEVIGEVNLRGRGFIEPGNGNTPYVGVISGSLVGSGTVEV